MTPKQAFIRLEKITKELTALYAEERKIQQDIGRRLGPWKLGDILLIRNPDTNRICYWRVMEMISMRDRKNKTMIPVVQARRCTRSGDYRGYTQRISTESLARAEIVRDSIAEEPDGEDEE